MTMRPIVLLAAAVAAGPAALANVATFDSISEGAFGPTLFDNGITLYDVDQNLGGGDNFSIDAVNDSSLGGSHSAPNVVNFGGYVPGTGCSFGRIQSFRATGGGLTQFASLDFWTLDFWGGNTVSMEAYLGTTLVGTDSFAVQVSFQPLHRYLSVSGQDFDSIRVISSGPHDHGVTFAVIDNVRMDVVPEPVSCLGLGAGIGMAAWRMRRRRAR